MLRPRRVEDPVLPTAFLQMFVEVEPGRTLYTQSATVRLESQNGMIRQQKYAQDTKVQKGASQWPPDANGPGPKQS